MSLLEQITADYIASMKNKEETKKTILNFVIAQAKNKKIEIQKDLEDDEIISLIKKEVKSLDEAMSFLEKADKPEQLAQEQEKKQILQSYLPATMSLEQTTELIDKLITDLNIEDLKTGRGALMKELMANYKSQVDSSLVNEVINAKLSA